MTRRMGRAPRTVEQDLASAQRILDREAESACLLDAEARIVAVNAAWDAFATGNGGPGCTGAVLVGSHYAAHVAGEEPGQRLAASLRRGLAGETVGDDSECNTPERFRHLRTLYLPVRARHDGPVAGLLVIHTVLREGPIGEVHPAHPPDEAAYRGAGGLIRMCSCCRRARRLAGPQRWDYVPAWVSQRPAEVTHGLCEACLVQYGAGDLAT
jgi:hypothetical protein